MDGIIVYGSLLATDDLASVFGENVHYTPVKVFGWRRCFNQRANYRESENGADCVLNVVRDPESWFNAILVTQLSDDAIDRYRERETGYELVEVSGSAIKPYGDEQESLDPENDYRVASGRRFTETPRPIPSYVSLCVDGAAEWGAEFLADFLVETYRR